MSLWKKYLEEDYKYRRVLRIVIPKTLPLYDIAYCLTTCSLGTSSHLQAQYSQITLINGHGKAFAIANPDGTVTAQPLRED